MEKGFSIGKVRRSVLSHEELGTCIYGTESGTLGVPGRVNGDVAGEEEDFVGEKSELADRGWKVGGEREEGQSLSHDVRVSSEHSRSDEEKRRATAKFRRRNHRPSIEMESRSAIWV